MGILFYRANSEELPVFMWSGDQRKGNDDIKITQLVRLGVIFVNPCSTVFILLRQKKVKCKCKTSDINGYGSLVFYCLAKLVLARVTEFASDQIQKSGNGYRKTKDIPIFWYIFCVIQAEKAIYLQKLP